MSNVQKCIQDMLLKFKQYTLKMRYNYHNICCVISMKNSCWNLIYIFNIYNVSRIVYPYTDQSKDASTLILNKIWRSASNKELIYATCDTVYTGGRLVNRTWTYCRFWVRFPVLLYFILYYNIMYTRRSCE